MSLFLNYAPGIINITAKVAPLLFTVSGSTDCGLTFSGDSAEHEHGSLTTVQPLTQLRPSGTAQTTDTNIAPGCGSAGHPHQYDSWEQHNLWTLTWLQVAMWAMNIDTDPGAAGPQPQQRPLSSSTYLDITSPWAQTQMAV